MKRLTMLMMLLLVMSVPALASGQCPPRPNDPKGAIDCGHLTCTRLVRDAAYVTGGSCSPAPGFTCCVQGKKQSQEGVPQGATVQLTRPNGQAFNYLPGAVEMRVDGVVVQRGTYRHGEFRWQDGTVSEDRLTCN